MVRVDSSLVCTKVEEACKPLTTRTTAGQNPVQNQLPEGICSFSGHGKTLSPPTLAGSCLKREELKDEKHIFVLILLHKSLSSSVLHIPHCRTPLSHLSCVPVPRPEAVRKLRRHRHRHMYIESWIRWGFLMLLLPHNQDPHMFIRSGIGCGGG